MRFPRGIMKLRISNVRGMAMKRASLVIASALLLAAPAAQAADMALKAPPAPAPVDTWTGVYIGINGGGGWSNSGTTTGVTNNGYFALANIPTVSAFGTNSIHSSGGLVGGQIGYLYQPQSSLFVFGVEAGIDWANINGSVSTAAVYPNNPPFSFTFNQSVKTEWLATFLGRIGIAANGWFPYITGGAAVADLKYSSIFQDNFVGLGPFNANSNFSSSTVKAAPTIGGGLEWRWDRHWSVRGEYLYMNFGSISGTSCVNTLQTPAACAPPGAFFANRASFHENVARAAISYKW